MLREGLEKGTGYSCDYRIMLPDGSIRYIHAEADRPVKDESGRVVRWFGVVQDVTEHKQIEEALRVSEERYRLLAETTQDMIHIIDRDLRVTYVNRAGADALGSTPEEVIGEQLETFFPPTTYKHMKNSLLRVFRSGKPITGQIMHQFYNGKISMHVILSPLFNNDGTVDGVMGSTRDITKLIETEEALLKSDSEFRALLQNIGSGVALIDETGRFAVVNPAFMRMFGLDRESDILNVNSQDWGRWKMYGEHLKLLDIDDHPVRKASMTGEPIRGALVAMRNPGAGKLTWMLISADPLKKEDGSVYRVVCTYNDITELKLTEEALLEAKAQVELYLDLMGHDISNMHQIALGYLEMVRDMQPEVSNREFLEKPMEVLQRSARLIKNVRKLQKLQEDEFRMQDMDVYTILAEVRHEYGSIPGKTITLNLNGEDHCLISANELLYDVFANLVGNSIKHTGDRADIVVNGDIVADNGRKYCRVTIEDDGPGIPDDFKPRIFNRRMEGTKHTKGMGLGLYLVKSLVDSYNGQVWIEDRVPGNHTKGAKFVVMLPATKTE